MKRIFITLTAALAIGFAMSSCVEQMSETNDELLLGRCLTPTEATAPVDRTDGRTVTFTWAESKGASQYTIEIFEGAEEDDPETVFAGTPFDTKVVEKSPLKVILPSDKFYFARVKAQSSNPDVQDSKWKEFPYPIGTYEVKTNLWPSVILRTSESITVQWTEIDADRVDHVRVSPDPEDETKAYKKYEVPSSENETVQMTVDGLNPSVKYTVAVHFKSANRGEVVAWTRPSLDNPTEVSTTEQLVQALNDGAKTILLAYSETSYDIAKTVKMPASADGISLYGNSTEAGQMPVISGELWIPDGLKKLHIEGISFDGDSYTYTHPLVFNADADDSMDEISVVNCSITGYKAGFFLNDNGKADVAKIVFNSIMVSDIEGDGGNGFDIRQQVNIGSIEISESTFTDGFRSFFRIDKAKVSELIFKNNTLNSMCYVEDGNNKGLFYIGTGKGLVAIPKFEMTDNLFLNMNGNKVRTLLFSDEVGVPTKMANNWYYKLGAGFWKSEKVKVGDNEETINADGKGKLTQTAGLAGGGQILSSDPCYDSAEGNLYVKNAAVLEAKVGDPRWLQTYKPVVEDLTLTPAAAGKSWNLMDTKTFGKTVKTSCVRDGLRFFVSANPFKVSEKGLEFAAAGTVEALGVPSDAAVAFMVDTPGTVIISSIKSNTGSPNGHITIATGPADGSAAKVAGSVNVGVEKAMLALSKVDSPQIVYVYGCSSMILTALQWSGDILYEKRFLETPVASLDKSIVDERADEEITISWNAVPNAGSYDVTYAGVTKNTDKTSYSFKTAGYEVDEAGGDFQISVVALPAEHDYSYEASSAAELSFHVNDVPDEPGIKVVRYNLTFPVGVNAEEKYVCENNAGFYVQTTGGWVIDANSQKFAVSGASEYDSYSTRLKGSKTSDSKTMTITVPNDGKLFIAARSANGSATDRTMALMQGDKEILAPTIIKDADKFTAGDASAFPYVVVDVKAGDIQVVLNNGINFYGIVYDALEGSAPAKIDKMWDFSASAWVEAMSAVEKNTNNSDWNLDIDGLKMIAGNSSIKWNVSGETYYWQPGGAGSATKRYFEFTTEVAGKLTVYASNTGDSEDLTRMVTVKVGDGAEQSLPGGYKSSAGAKPFEFDITAGTVKIYPTGNSLRFYKIEFHSN